MSGDSEIVRIAAEQGWITGIAKWVIGAIVSLLSVLVGIIWRKHNAEIEAMKTSIANVGESIRGGMKAMDDRLDKMEREYTPLSAHETTRAEMREGIIDLHRKIETTNAQLTAKIDAQGQEASRRHSELMNTLLQHGRRNG